MQISPNWIEGIYCASNPIDTCFVFIFYFMSSKHPIPNNKNTTVIFIDVGNSKIELLHPLGDNSPIAKFLDSNPGGGMHHLCFDVEDITAARDQLTAQGARVLGDGEPKAGAHGKPVLFLHPKDFTGTLIELEQV